MKTTWKIGIVKDRARPMLGLHGHQVAFLGLPGVEIAALADSCTEGIGEILSMTRAKRHYTDYREMLEREALDIVVLCSRHPADHFPQIEAAAERGVHVYCEKPMTVSLREADRIVDLCERSRIKVCVAHPARYDPAYLTMKHRVESGGIGTPLTAYGRGKNDHRGGGEDLMVLGTHILDLMTFHFGDPESVWAEVTSQGRPIGPADCSETVEPVGPTAGDAVFAHFRFPGGIRGIFESRAGLLDATDGAVHMGLTVTGTKGSLSMRFCDREVPGSRLRISRQAAPLEDGGVYEAVPLEARRPIPGAEPLDYTLIGKRDICGARWFLEANRFAAWDLLQSIEEDRPPVSNAGNARVVLEMMHGIYASHLSGRVVRFPLPDRDHPLRGP